MKIKVLLGDFTFIEPELNYPKFDTKQGCDFIQDNQSYYTGRFLTIINNIRKIEYVNESELDDFCESSLEFYEGYLIPSKYNGEILNNHK